MNVNWGLVAGLAAACGALFAIGLVIAGSGNDLRALVRRRPSTRSLHHLAAQASGIAERSLDRSGRRGGVEAALERAGVNIRAGEFLVIVGAVAASAFLLGGIFIGPLAGLIFAVVVLFGAPAYLKVMVDRRRAKFEAQLEQTLPLLAGSLRAGFGVMQSLDAVARDSESPTSDEFARLVMESRLGRELGDSLHALSERIGSEDFDFVVQAIDIHREVGGDLAEVLDSVTSTIRDRNRIRRQIKTLTAEGRISAGILLALPVVMFFVVQTINPDYLHELTGTSGGRVMLAVGVGLLAVGALWTKRLIKLVF
jgi:tight adherence protein B